MHTPEPIQKAIAHFANLLDQLIAEYQKL